MGLSEDRWGCQRIGGGVRGWVGVSEDGWGCQNLCGVLYAAVSGGVVFLCYHFEWRSPTCPQHKERGLLTHFYLNFGQP